jgi:uncharacterized protein (DUF1778 family)
MADPHNRDAVAFLVTVPEADSIIRVNVTFRRSALDRIDRAAKQNHQTRSAFLAEAALDRVG